MGTNGDTHAHTHTHTHTYLESLHVTLCSCCSHCVFTFEILALITILCTHTHTYGANMTTSMLPRACFLCLAAWWGLCVY